MYAVSQKFIDYCKRHQRTFKSATITYDDNGTTKTISSDKIIKIEISATPYIDYQLIGQAPAKKIHINLYGTDYDLTNKEISVTTTMYYDDETNETLNLGSYIISSDYESQVKDQCSYTGYDYMIKFDTTYSDEGLEYPCTLQDVLNNICEQNDIELYSTNITNGDLIVNGNNFDGSFTYRDVIKQIAQCSGTFAYIDRLNKLHIDNLSKMGKTGGTILQFPLQGTLQIDDNATENVKDEITPSYYLADFKSSRLYGPVNKVQITMTDVDDATYKQDSQNISQNGIQTITINDNFFLGTIDAREHAIKGLWTSLYGIKYIPFSSTYLGFPYLEMGDLIEVEQLDGTTIESYVFNYTFVYNGGYMGSLETPTITRTQETYPTNSIEAKMGKFGFEVDRANKEVRAVAEDLSGVQAELTLKIDKDDNDQIVSMINASADVITLNSNRLIINSSNFVLDADGNITATGGTIGGWTIGEDELSITSDNYEVFLRDGSNATKDVLVVHDMANGTYPFYVRANGQTVMSNASIEGGNIDLTSGATITGNGFVINQDRIQTSGVMYVGTSSSYCTIGQGILTCASGGVGFSTDDLGDLDVSDGSTTTSINGGYITCTQVTQTSKAEEKKDFEKYQGALKEIENIDIYKYRMKNEEGKKHIGFVIGDDFKYSKEVTNQNNDGVDIYSFVSLCCQAIKELQEEIKELKEIKNE